MASEVAIVSRPPEDLCRCVSRGQRDTTATAVEENLRGGCKRRENGSEKGEIRRKIGPEFSEVNKIRLHDELWGAGDPGALCFSKLESLNGFGNYRGGVDIRNAMSTSSSVFYTNFHVDSAPVEIDGLSEDCNSCWKDKSEPPEENRGMKMACCLDLVNTLSFSGITIESFVKPWESISSLFSFVMGETHRFFGPPPSSTSYTKAEATVSKVFIFSLFLLMWLPSPARCTGIQSAALRDYRFNSKNVTALLDSLLAKNHYDNRIRPDFGGPPLLITVNMHIKSMGPVSETDEMYAMDCYFRQVWYDRRLSFNLSGLTEFSMSWLFLERVWKPDTFFMNGKKSYLHRITVPNKFIRLRNDGFLTYSMRLTINARCKMHLRKFPLDSQACPLLIGSYGYSSRDVLYKWQSPTSVGHEAGVELAQYDLVSIETEDEDLVLRGKDTYSVISVFFFLKRHTGYFMLQVYVPCGLIVSCSWVSFWIDPDAVPARVSLGVTTVLSMTTMGFGGRAQMPKVSYATALDWFVILCFSFVFAVMVEYAAINFIDKVRTDLKRKLEEEKKKEAAEKEEEMNRGGKKKEGVEGGEEEDEEERKKRLRKKEMVGKGKGGGPGGAEGEVMEGKRRDEDYASSNMILGGIGDNEVVRVIVETVGDDDPGTGGQGGGVGGVGVTGVGGGVKKGPAGHGVVGMGVIAPKDNIEWEDDEYDEDEDELDVVGNGAGPEDVVEMAVSDSADRLGVACDADHGRGGSSLRRARSVTASPVDTPRWQHTLLAPIRAWRSSRLISRDELGSVMIFWGSQGEQGPPGRTEAAGEAEDASVPAGKFSRIDITSRRMFPIMFFVLISIYWVAYMYYITDEYEVWSEEGEAATPKRNVVFLAGDEEN